MQRKSTEDLCELARCGGSIVLYADTRPVDELARIARTLNHGAMLTIHGTAMRPVEELVQIAKAAPGRVTFAG